MKRPLLDKALALAAVAGAGLVLVASAGAHGTLTPAATPAGASQRFELTVPNSRLDADVVAVSLQLPSDAVLESAEAAQPRWAVTSTESSVQWSGGPIERGSTETFAFVARLPTDPGPVQFTLVETYDDGAGAPFPITVVATGEAGSDDSASTLAAAALVVAVLALLVATLALALAIRGRASSGGP
jgi:uncharacterized protein YcnI